jgi:hypothetical protein
MDIPQLILMDNLNIMNIHNSQASQMQSPLHLQQANSISMSERRKREDMQHRLTISELVPILL